MVETFQNFEMEALLREFKQKSLYDYIKKMKKRNKFT